MRSEPTPPGRAEGPLPVRALTSQGLAPSDRPVWAVAQPLAGACGAYPLVPHSTCISSTTQHSGPWGAALTATHSDTGALSRPLAHTLGPSASAALPAVCPSAHALVGYERLQRGP